MFCKAVWGNRHSELLCDKYILSAVWEDGDPVEVRRTKHDPWVFSKIICSDQCERSIYHNTQRIYDYCHERTDRFAISKYEHRRKAFFDKHELSEGPTQAKRGLEERYHRLCKHPQVDSVWGSYAAHFWLTWGIVDGRNARNMNGLHQFLEATSKRKSNESRSMSGAFHILGGKKQYRLNSPRREVGPGKGETSCGYCMLDRLERKMRSFEYGAMIDPATGDALGLLEFNSHMVKAIERCERDDAYQVFQRIYKRWSMFGWWCDGKPCHVDHNITTEVRTLLHEFKYDDKPLPELRDIIGSLGATKQAAIALHDELLSLQWSNWLDQATTFLDIMPNQYRVLTLCSNRCHNAIDRLNDQHSAKFAAVANDELPYNVFKTWQLASQQVDKICLISSWNGISTETTPFCAPGYAALDHPEYLFAEPLKLDIIAVFSHKIVELEDRLLKATPPLARDVEGFKVLARAISETVCNPCAGALFVGPHKRWGARVKDFLNDREINVHDHIKTAKKFFITCARLKGRELSQWELVLLWKKTGLDAVVQVGNSYPGLVRASSYLIMLKLDV